MEKSDEYEGLGGQNTNAGNWIKVGSAGEEELSMTSFLIGGTGQLTGRFTGMRKLAGEASLNMLIM